MTNNNQFDQILEKNFEADFFLGGFSPFFQILQNSTNKNQINDCFTIKDGYIYHDQLKLAQEISCKYFYLDSDHYYMAIALLLAHFNIQHCSPNPCVGCVYVVEKKIIGFGYTTNFGKDHAEKNAVKFLKDDHLLSQAKVYVSLEPCCHRDDNSCAKFLIDSKVSKVFISVQDQDHRVNGQGIKALKQAGIPTIVGVLANCGNKLYSRYNLHRKNNHKVVIGLKWAQSLDAKLAAADGRSQWISSNNSLLYSQWLRYGYDMIMVGSQTVINDRPALSLRHKFVANYLNNPIKVIFDPFLTAFNDKSFVDHYRYLCSCDCTVVWLSCREYRDKAKLSTHWKRLDSDQHRNFLFILDKKDIFGSLKYVFDDQAFIDVVKKKPMSLLVEGGSRLHSLLIANSNVDFIHVVTSAKLLGGYYGLKITDGLYMPDSLNDKSLFQIVTNSMVGEDCLVELVRRS